jgi:hypothetical protein
MKPVPIFLSWSGERSRKVALVLRRWLPDIFQSVEPFMSEEDIAKGTVWFDKISDALNESKFGIVCLTSENQRAPWLMFEAGAMCKQITTDRVCPLCVDLKPTEVVGPLARLQAADANSREEMWKLINSINDHLQDRGLKEDRLRGQFERCWRDYEDPLREIQNAAPAPPEPRRGVEEMVEELVGNSRAIMDRVIVIEHRIGQGNALAHLYPVGEHEASGRNALRHYYNWSRDKGPVIFIDPMRVVFGHDRAQPEPEQGESEAPPKNKAED